MIKYIKTKKLFYLFWIFCISRIYFILNHFTKYLKININDFLFNTLFLVITLIFIILGIYYTKKIY